MLRVATLLSKPGFVSSSLRLYQVLIMLPLVVRAGRERGDAITYCSRQHRADDGRGRLFHSLKATVAGGRFA